MPNFDKYSPRQRLVAGILVGTLGGFGLGWWAKDKTPPQVPLPTSRAFNAAIFGPPKPGTPEDMKNRKALVHEKAVSIAKLALKTGPEPNRTIKERIYQGPSGQDTYVERDITATTPKYPDYKYVAKIVFYKGVRSRHEAEQVSSISLYEYNSSALQPQEPTAEFYLAGAGFNPESGQYASWWAMAQSRGLLDQSDPDLDIPSTLTEFAASGQTTPGAVAELNHYDWYGPAIFGNE